MACHCTAVTRLRGEKRGSEIEGRPCDFTAAVRLRGRARQKECVCLAAGSKRV